jgi:hypothetical protein
MRIRRCGQVGVVVLAAVLMMVGSAAGDNNPNGMVFRAVGWFKGKSEISQDQIKCEIPTVTSAISEGSFAVGLWNTYGRATLYYPDINNPFGNPCGVWIQLQNNLLNQGIQLDHVELRYRIQGALRMRGAVPTRKNFPRACAAFRHDTHFVGARLEPANSSNSTSQSGAPNVAFIEMLPLVQPELFDCLRQEYVGRASTLFASLPLVVRATAVGMSDTGDTFRSNTISYTLNLRHSCGNGRVDDGEVCDPTTPFNSCVNVCQSGACSQSGEPCDPVSNPCQNGACTGQDIPAECVCVF